MDDNTLLLSEILQELRTLNHNITIIYGNASHDIQDINANLGSMEREKVTPEFTFWYRKTF